MTTCVTLHLQNQYGRQGWEPINAKTPLEPNNTKNGSITTDTFRMIFGCVRDAYNICIQPIRDLFQISKFVYSSLNLL